MAGRNQEVKKMKQGMSYSGKEKTIILNVFKYFRQEFPDTCVTDIVKRTSKATGCSEKSIFQFRKEEASVEGFKEPSKTKIRKNININSRFIKYDDSVRDAIRHIIYDLKYKDIVPSLNTILKNVNTSASLPKFSLMTLRRLLFDMGFTYEKIGQKSILVEKSNANVTKPANFLKDSGKRGGKPLPLQAAQNNIIHVKNNLDKPPMHAMVPLDVGFPHPPNPHLPSPLPPPNYLQPPDCVSTHCHKFSTLHIDPETSPTFPWSIMRDSMSNNGQ